ncbi:MAG: hypothetical protein ACRDQZ_04710 [Mycobacteriales bacterium]
MPAPSKIRASGGNEFQRRVAQYVNERFGGNLTTAAQAIGCSYDQLRNFATGRTLRPSLDLIQLLLAHSGRSAEWWLWGEEQA